MTAFSALESFPHGMVWLPSACDWGSGDDEVWGLGLAYTSLRAYFSDAAPGRILNIYFTSFPFLPLSERLLRISLIAVPLWVRPLDLSLAEL